MELPDAKETEQHYLQMQGTYDSLSLDTSLPAFDSCFFFFLNLSEKKKQFPSKICYVIQFPLEISE